jgi:hypothetical protein
MHALGENRRIGGSIRGGLAQCVGDWGHHAAPYSTRENTRLKHGTIGNNMFILFVTYKPNSINFAVLPNIKKYTL